jgi:hypothetical protein
MSCLLDGEAGQWASDSASGASYIGNLAPIKVTWEQVWAWAHDQNKTCVIGDIVWSISHHYSKPGPRVCRDNIISDVMSGVEMG